MAAPGFSFGGGGGLFGAKSTAAPSTGLFGGTTSGLSLAKTTTASTGLFGGIKTNTGTGLFGGTTVSSASTGLLGSTTGGGLFGATSTTGSNALKLGGGTGLTLGGGLGAPSTGLSLGGGLGAPTTGLTLGGGLGASATGTLGAGLSLGTTTTSTAASEKLENPKDAKVPSEITTLFTDLEKYINSQKEVKEQISKISSQAIGKCLEEVTTLKQLLSVVATGINKDSVAIETLKNSVNIELKYADIAQKVKDIRPNMHCDFVEPMEYFKQLVFSFENQINSYRQEIHELETVLSSTSAEEFLPQHLSETLKRMNDTFLSLASQVHPVHEAIKLMKRSYLHYRQTVHGDSNDPFKTNKYSSVSKDRSNTAGPSPFPVQHRTLMAAATPASAGTSSTSFGSISTQSGISSSFFKPAAGQGLFRSHSSGASSRSTSATAPTLGASLFNNSGLLPGASPTVNSLQLQKSAGKRVKF